MRPGMGCIGGLLRTVGTPQIPTPAAKPIRATVTASTISVVVNIG